MEKFVQRSYLFDFYGELLTEHQRRIYSAVVFDDYSLSEIAREEGVSRQGIHDLMRRCDKTLEDYENRLGLVARFLKIRDQVRKIQDLTAQAASAGEADGTRSRIHRIADGILEEL